MTKSPRVAILSYQNTALFELACAVELFALPRPEFEHWYSAKVVCFDQGPLTATGGIQLVVEKVDSLDAFDMLIVPSWPTNISQIRGQLAEAVKEFYAAGKRIVSFCSGAFLLGALGILDNRTATTHWRYATKFKQRFPSAEYVEDVLYVCEGNIACSAGSAAAIDLSLEIIRQDFGSERANQVARRLVISAHRKGGQSQFIEASVQAKSSLFSDSIDWALANLNSDFSIDQLAARASMSRRTFDRKFRQSFGTSAKDWLVTQRLHLARDLLEKSSHNIELIAQDAGFDNAASMRHHFRRVLGVSPRQYRDQFGSLTNPAK